MKCNYSIIVFIFATILFSINQLNAQNMNHSQSKIQPEIAGIAINTAIGNQDALKVELNNGLDAGLTINEIKEVLVQLYAYCGFPRSLNAINTFRGVLNERTSKGIKAELGKTIVVENKVADKYEQGRKTLEELTQTPQSKPAPGFGEFALRADAFLKEHLFADIFSSDVLTYAQREYATISALSALDGVEPQLKSHITMGKNVGINDNQLKELAVITEQYAGRAQANILRRLIGERELPLTEPDMLVRISEIEIVPDFLTDYKKILQETSSEAVKSEQGVIAIYPMFQKENPTQARIVEIYADKKAYETHLQTTHFIRYKESTLKMVKSLKLVDMDALDVDEMPTIFKKIK